MNAIFYFLRGWIYGLRNLPMDLLRRILSVLKTILSIPWMLIAPFVVPPILIVCHFVNKHAPGFWIWVTSPKFIRRFITGLVVKKFGNVTPPRPHAYSMFAKYPSWTGLVNLTFTGRHLGPRPTDVNALPSEADLEHLFLRPAASGAQVDCVRSNLLFMAFAQWFTDSFLRTSHKLEYDRNGDTQSNPDGTRIREEGRERENNSNHEIDLCQIYGMNRTATNILRFRPSDPGYDPKLHKGTLKSQMLNGEEYPVTLLAQAPKRPEKPGDKTPYSKLTLAGNYGPVFESEELLRTIFSSAIYNKQGYETLFLCGLEHGNSTIGNTLFNTIFLRMHNHVARKIATAHGDDFDDDEVFEKARNVMIVLLLKIVVSDYVRHISPLNLPFLVTPNAGKDQNWYRRNRIHIEFNLLYRWHSLVPDVFPFLPHQDNALRNFASYRHNNKWLIDRGVSRALEDFMSAAAGKMTLGNTPRAMHMVKRETLKLMRASNLGSYNEYRKRFSLHPAKSFEEVTGEKVMAAALSDLYGGDINKLEFYIGLVAERHGTGGMMGDLLLNMVAHDALTHALTNPLLAEEMHLKLPEYDVEGEHVFTAVGKKIIDEIETLDQLLQRILDTPPQSPVSFRHPDA